MNSKSKIRFYYFYFILAFFNFIVILGSLFLTLSVHKSLDESIVISKNFLIQMQKIDELSNLATDLNAPGNNIFSSKNFNKESEQLLQTTSKIYKHLDTIEKENLISKSELKKTKTQVQKMILEAKLVLDSFQQKKSGLAGIRMAEMDQSLASIQYLIAQVRSHIVTKYDEQLQKEKDTRNSLNIYENILLIVVLILSLGTVSYGYFVGRSFEAKDQLLIQSAKMSSLGEMAAGVAHEVNNPLATIRLRASQLRRLVLANKSTPQQSIEFLQGIEDTTLRISKIVEGLRTFARQDADQKMTTVAFSKVAEDLIGICGDRAKNQGIKLEIIYDKDLNITAQIVQIEQVLINLLVNGMDAISDQKDPWIKIEALEQNERLVISITDSGHGIPEPIASKMMQPFFTTKPIGKGTGLGLSISHGIAEAHSGKLELNKACANTQFILSLPLAQAHPKMQNKAA